MAVIAGGVLAISVGLAGLTIWTWPSFVVDSGSLPAIFRAAGIKAKWDQATLDVRSVSFLKKQIVFHAVNFCIDEGNDFTGCARQADVAAVVEFPRYAPRVRVESLLLAGVTGRTVETPGPAAASPSTELWPVPPGVFRRVVFEQLRVLVERYEYVMADGKIAAKGSITGLNAWKLDAAIELPGKQALTVKLAAKPLGGYEFGYTAEVVFREESYRLTATLAGKGTATSLHADARAEIAHRLRKVPQIAIDGCHLDVDAKTLAWKCPATVKADGKSLLTADVKGSLDRGRGSEVALDARLAIPRFEDLVALSNQYPWSVPAPFTRLQGEVALETSGKGELARGTAFPFTFRTRLASATQKLDLDGKGDLRVESREKLTARLTLDLTLTDVRLALPRLDLGPPPPLLRDPRIRTTPETPPPAGPPAFTYDIDIHTPAGHPVGLLSNLAEAPVPLTVELRLKTGDPVTGRLRFETFPMELFHRKGTIEYLELGFGAGVGKTTLKGEINVVYTDYIVHISLMGTTQEPRVKLSSSPSLPDDQVVAVLIFGRRIEALDPNQSSTVGNTKAGLADGAVTLASMYLLASTPIESVGYDPTTKVFTAKVRLADGTSLNIGSDMSQLNQIGVRKRLGANWSVSTYLQNPLDSANASLTAFLEWSKGY